MDQPASLDNRMNILRMIENRQITADQGALLLSNSASASAPSLSAAAVQPVEVATTPQPAVQTPGLKGRFFKVLVTDIASGKVRTQVTLPLRLVDWGLRHGARFNGEVKNIDMDELNEIITSGESGKLVDVWDAEDGEHVEIVIE